MSPIQLHIVLMFLELFLYCLQLYIVLMFVELVLYCFHRKIRRNLFLQIFIFTHGTWFTQMLLSLSL